MNEQSESIVFAEMMKNNKRRTVEYSPAPRPWWKSPFKAIASHLFSQKNRFETHKKIASVIASQN